MPGERMRIGVLCSGRGSNLQAILDHQASLGAAAAADVVLVASDRAGAGALAQADLAARVDEPIPIIGERRSWERGTPPAS